MITTIKKNKDLLYYHLSMAKSLFSIVGTKKKGSELMSNLVNLNNEEVKKLLEFLILRVLENEGKSLTQTEISKKIGIYEIEHNNLTTSNLLNKLESEKKVERKGKKGPYEITENGKELFRSLRK